MIFGLLFPATATWGAHVGGLIGGAAVGAVLCQPLAVERRRRLLSAAILAAAIAITSGLLAPRAAQHTAAHGPVLIGVGPTERGAEAAVAKLSTPQPIPEPSDASRTVTFVS